MEFLVKFAFIFPFIKTKPPKKSEIMVACKAFVVRCRRFWFRQLQSEKAAWQDQGSVKRSGEGEARCERDGNSRNLLNIAAGGGFPRIQYCHRNLLELTQQKTYFGTFTIWTNMYRHVKKIIIVQLSYWSFIPYHLSVSSDTSPKTAIVVSIGKSFYSKEVGRHLWETILWKRNNRTSSRLLQRLLSPPPTHSTSPLSTIPVGRKPIKGKKRRAFEVRKPGFFWSISSSNMCDTRPRNSLFTIKNIPVFHHRNDKMTKNTQDCVLLKNIVEMHRKLLMMISMTLKVLEDFVINWELGCCFSIWVVWELVNQAIRYSIKYSIDPRYCQIHVPLPALLRKRPPCWTI